MWLGKNSLWVLAPVQKSISSQTCDGRCLCFCIIVLAEYGSDKFKGSSVCFLLLELNVCFPHTSAFIKCYTIMNMNQRWVKGHMKALSSSVFPFLEVKLYVILSTQQRLSSCEDFFNTVKYSFRFICFLVFFFLCVFRITFLNIYVNVHIYFSLQCQFCRRKHHSFVKGEIYPLTWS